MINNKFFRFAGWWAFASAVLLIASFVFLYIAHDIGDILLTVFFLALIVTFYALYVTHRTESSGLSLVGLILVFPAVGVAIAANNSNNTILSYWLYLLVSLPFLIFGFLGFRSAKMPRGLAVVTLLAGVTYLISGVAGLLRSEAIAGNVSMLSTLLVLVWLVWLWRAFLSKRMTVAVPAPVAA